MCPTDDSNELFAIGEEFEKYTVESLLGRGGNGAVYLVRHNILDTHCALKVLFPHIARQNPQFVQRFLREAKLASKIKHPNLIAVHDAGHNEKKDLYYLVMDYAPGGSVRQLIKQETRVPLQRSISIMRQVASALDMAHSFGMVHRDIKPDNIMFDGDGVVRLADLGIAKATGDHDANLTVEAAVFGTPSYMSPEQARDSRKVDIRADIYSLGIVLFEMLTGRRPFAGENTIEILTQVISDTPAPDVRTLNPEIPESVAVLVADMIAKDLRKRIASPSDLISRIDVILSNMENSEEAVAEQPEVEKTMATIVQPVAAQAAELTMETVAQPAPQPQPAPSQAELTMETIAQPAPSQPQPAPSQPEKTMATIAQPPPAAQKVSEPAASQPFEPTIAIGTAETPSPSSGSGGMDKRKMMIIGGAAVGLLLIVGGAMVMKGGKEPNKPSDHIETPADNGGKDVQKIVETPQPTGPQPSKTETELSPKVEEQPAAQAVVKTEPKIEEQPAAQAVVKTEPKVEAQPVQQPAAQPEEKKEEQSVAQSVVKTEPKAAEKTVAQSGQADATAAEIQAKIAFFGAENTALLQDIRKMAGEQNTTFMKAGLSSRTKSDLMRLQIDKPDLMLIAVTSRYETLSLSNFELFVADLCDSLRSRGGNYAFVLEPIEGKSARFCNGNNVVRDICRQRSINVIDCENGKLKADDVKMLLAP
jgi:serine/threonine-protein kinase